MVSAGLTADVLGKPAWAWLVFLGIVTTLLVLDLGVLHRKAREIRAGESLALSAAYILIALVFGAWVWSGMGREAGVAWLTGFFVEKTLALDNVFVISLIFATLAVPPHLQHRVLFYGILGVIVLRAVMIGLGTAIVSSFAWVLFLFGAILIATGIKMMVVAENPSAWVDNRVMRWMHRRLRVTRELHGEAFFVRRAAAEGGPALLHATPLFVALVLIEFADLVFAVDSVPAIFAITTDPYIVYTSNIFAILGLRALYFALAASVHRFRYLKYALSLVLVFIGAKIFWNQIVGKVDPLVSLGVTATLLAGGVIYSIVRTRREPAAADPERAAPRTTLLGPLFEEKRAPAAPGAPVARSAELPSLPREG
ncbi:TerC family protein [Rhodoplanes sp. TEM]|uniref:TerC family protein n=1 Tax=Rhodoplanes tepidamans TaxID=200616 RepID=A0ABT5J9T7_RHOTP|nr:MULTISPECIES: TerC family protein [Rhodoplanes]MDC7786359.1 TerC family protein [Rhodoplanes tepidamans]MDC7985431.1 TerC family protein [Rhodoplanes sp. TEM]